MGVTVKGGLTGGLKIMGDNDVLGIVKFPVEQVVNMRLAQNAVKGLVVNKLLYGCGTLDWSLHKSNNVQVKDLMQRKKKKYFSFYIDNILIETSSI